MLLNIRSGATYRTIAAPRRYCCLCLPDEFVPPVGATQQALLAERCGEALGIEQVTPYVQPLGHGKWMIALFHGRPSPHRAATYENGSPGSISYTPRQVALLMVDAQQRLLYLSCADPRRVIDLSYALNGTLFPGRLCAMPFLRMNFDLGNFRYLSLNDRAPCATPHPWRRLSLKAMEWSEPGSDAPLMRTTWPEDGFEALDLHAFEWPLHPHLAALQVFLPTRASGYAVAFANDSAFLRAALSPATLPAVGKLVELCMRNRSALPFLHD